MNMMWYEEAVFYHIYPLGLTGAPKENAYTEPVHRLNTLLPWIDHLKKLGVTGLYIGPLFESVGHGYETTDYKQLTGSSTIPEGIFSHSATSGKNVSSQLTGTGTATSISMETTSTMTASPMITGAAIIFL